MFTLKLFRRAPVIKGSPLQNNLETLTLEVDRVQTYELGERDERGQYTTLEVVAFFKKNDDLDRFSFYVGEKQPQLTAMEYRANSYDWGLLENSAGKTTSHFRPHTYG